MNNIVGSSLLMVMVCAVVPAVGGLGGGCKGQVKVQDNPETTERLKQCTTSLKEKDEYINDLNKRVTELEGSGGDAQVVVTIQGEAMTIKVGKDKGPNAGAGVAKGTAKDAELYEAFLSQLKRSRGAIKKCYQSALKKNGALSTRTVTLNIGVDYKTNGKVKKAAFSPRVSDQFNHCMDGVAKNWTLPGMPRSISFNYKQTLTPE